MSMDRVYNAGNWKATTAAATTHFYFTPFSTKLSWKYFE